MFTGIIQYLLPILHVQYQTNFCQFSLKLPPNLSPNLTPGASLAIDGVCLTITKIQNHTAHFDVMAETLQRTTLKYLYPNRKVNVERAAKLGEEIGGHLLSGHVSDTAQITHIHTPPNNHILTFSVQPKWTKYIFAKGYIALDGVSLTVLNNPQNNQFQVSFIPETLNKTTFGQKKIGDLVNLEIDPQTQAIVDTVERILTSQNQHHSP